MRRRRMRRRSGFVIGLVVFAGLTFLALAIYPTLFFSGSQTRSEAHSQERWQTRLVARNGLVVATNLLRKQRWWDAGSDVVTLTYLGTRSSSDLGLDESQGSFEILAELIKTPGQKELPDGTEYEELHHIDVFVRARRGEDSMVAYGAFLMTPSPELFGSSTEGAPGGPTTKRMVRTTFFPEPEHQDVTQESVRDAIREAIRLRSAECLANYQAIDWEATPSHLAAGAGDAEALAFLEDFVATPGGGEDPGSTFLRDRLHDVLFQGTPVGFRTQAAWYRRLDTGLTPCPPEADAAEFLCAKVSGCVWEVPACRTPDAWDVDPTGTSPGDQTALAVHEGAVGATPDAGYIDRIVATEPILRDYDFGCSVTYSASLTSGDVPAGAFRNPYDGNRWCTGAYCNIGPLAGRRNYVLEARGGSAADADVVYQARLAELADFFRKYYGLEEGEPIPDAIVSGGYLSPPSSPTSPGGGGGSPPTSTYGGGFSG